MGSGTHFTAARQYAHVLESLAMRAAGSKSAASLIDVAHGGYTRQASSTAHQQSHQAPGKHVHYLLAQYIH